MSERFVPFQQDQVRTSRALLPIVFIALALVLVTVVLKWSSGVGSLLGRRSNLSRSDLARALSLREPSSPQTVRWSGLPGTIEISTDQSPQRAIVQYSFDAALQSEIEALFQQYLPDYGAFAAVDPETGRVLALVSHEKRGRSSYVSETLDEHLALRATFPAASVFKVVTAAAAIAETRFSADTRVAFNGSNHTLFKGNVLKNSQNRWTRNVSLRDAFAQSINTVFGKIGVFSVGAERLRDYAGKFGFNRRIASDLPFQSGRALISADSDDWSLAETASGFTRETTMSPLQGALIAASIVNGGKMMQPYAVESVHLPEGDLLYQAEVEQPALTVPPEVATELMELMRQTVISGTSRRSFRGFSKASGGLVDVGGKTGSLTGYHPPGKYDWFVGFGKMGGRAIALAVLTIHREQWRVKSSYIARKAIERYLLGY